MLKLGGSHGEPEQDESSQGRRGIYPEKQTTVGYHYLNRLRRATLWRLYEESIYTRGSPSVGSQRLSSVQRHPCEGDYREAQPGMGYWSPCQGTWHVASESKWARRASIHAGEEHWSWWQPAGGQGHVMARSWLLNTIPYISAPIFIVSFLC